MCERPVPNMASQVSTCAMRPASTIINQASSGARAMQRPPPMRGLLSELEGTTTPVLERSWSAKAKREHDAQGIEPEIPARRKVCKAPVGSPPVALGRPLVAVKQTMRDRDIGVLSAAAIKVASHGAPTTAQPSHATDGRQPDAQMEAAHRSGPLYSQSAPGYDLSLIHISEPTRPERSRMPSSA